MIPLLPYFKIMPFPNALNCHMYIPFVKVTALIPHSSLACHSHLAFYAKVTQNNSVLIPLLRASGMTSE